MKQFCLAMAAAAGMATAAFAQAMSGPAMDGSPAWFLQMPPPPKPAKAGVAPKPAMVMNGSRMPLCVHAPVCDPVHGGSPDRGQLKHVEWRQTMGYTYSYPFDIPRDDNGLYRSGVPAIGIDSKGNFWVFQRNAPGRPQLFEYGPDHKLIRTVGENAIGHQMKAHGLEVDAQDNVWIADADGSTVKEVSPEGKLIRTIGVKGRRGDWDEARGQRLLWQPMDIAFAPNGDIYIGEGHANESPNDVGSGDPADNIGAARIIHLGRDGKFINQWFGNAVGQGRFSMAHGIAVDPRNGDVWIGDREQYRLVVYTAGGQFIKTIQMRNLTCAIDFDAQGNLWISSGQDGQLLKLDRGGKVLGAVGNGQGRGPGQAVEVTYMAWDKAGNVYTGDTSVARVTKWSPPRK